MRESQSQVPEALVNRGVGWQAAGFTLTGIACLAILRTFEGSDFWLYQWSQSLSVDLYWSTIVPLAFLFDWVRKMFESAKAIREAKKAEIREKALREGEERERARIMKELRELEAAGVTFPPMVAEAVLRKRSEDNP